jgi:bifunctional ADP-heptose synthase (sugar kinase/adenylyltransferase)
VPSLPVNAHDPTGAGDVFGAAFVLGTLRGWPLRQRLAFANLCAALSVQYVGGSLAAPGWGDIIDWLASTRARAAGGSSHAAELAQSYAFIEDVLPESGRISVRRARATIARTSDAEAHRR